MELTTRQTASRDVDFGREQRFRILLNRDMLEVYVNDYLTILARVNNTGRFGLLSGEDPRGIESTHFWRSANPSERPNVKPESPSVSTTGSSASGKEL